MKRSVAILSVLALNIGIISASVAAGPGAGSGRISDSEAQKIGKQQERMSGMKDKASSDGNLSKGEKKRLGNAQKQGSKTASKATRN